ncbi:transposase [Leptospira noguchii]|nr:transposase [Leptospira noguchii]UOG62187.1 transposase [Leptospira noguchii]
MLNKHLSKVRSRVEHVFADIKSFGGKSIRCRTKVFRGSLSIKNHFMFF